VLLKSCCGVDYQIKLLTVVTDLVDIVDFAVVVACGHQRKVHVRREGTFSIPALGLSALFGTELCCPD
jgi:hypothetical protein